MKNDFKKIIGIPLICFGSVVYGASFSEAEIQQRFDNVSEIYKMSMFDRLLDEGNVLLLGPALINDYLGRLPKEKAQQKALLLCQKALHEMPVALAVKCISFLPRAEDKIHYSERLLRERDLNSLEWWGFFIGGQYSASRRGYDIRWHGYELLGYFPVAKKVELVEMILEKYWDCFSMSSTENFSYTDIPFLIAYFPIDSLQRVLYVKRFLETKDFTISYNLLHDYIGELCFLISPKEQNALVVDLFGKKFDALPLGLSMVLYEKLTEQVDISSYGKRLLLSKKIEMVSDKERSADYMISRILFFMFQDDSGDKKAFLEQHFDTLSANIIMCLISQLGLKRMHYLNQLIVSKKIENLSEKQIDLLFWGVSRFGGFAPDESTTSMAILLLDRFFETSSASVIVSLLNKISEKSDWKAMLGNALFGTVRKKYFHRLVASGKLKSESDFRNTFLGLSKDERKDVVTVFKKSLDTVTSEQAFLIFNYVSDKEKEAWLRKNNVFWKVCCSDDPKATGPLFSKNDETIINFLKKSSLTGERIKHVKLMMSDFKEFMEEQYRQDRIVFLHGQQDQWAFLAGIFDDLITIKYGHSIPEDFVRLRFQERSVIKSDDVVRATRERGIPSREAFKDIWFHLLFTNLHLLANEEGSNTLLYFLKNYDQTTNQKRFDFKTGIKALFSELDMLSEYDALMKEMPTLFTDLYDAYKKDVVARGDIGRLIAISMQKGVAQRLAYSSTFGGPHKSIDIDGEPTVDVVKIAERFGQAPYENEHVVIMSKEVTDPYEALQAGTKMRFFTADSNEKSLPLAYEFEEKRTAFKSWVTGLYLQRKEAIRRFKQSCPYALGYNPFTVAAVGAMIKK